MGKRGDVILENLARYHTDALRAVAKRDRQLQAAIEVGKRSDEIAAALGCSPNNVRNLKAWKERAR